MILNSILNITQKHQIININKIIIKNIKICKIYINTLNIILRYILNTTSSKQIIKYINKIHFNTTYQNKILIYTTH